MKENLYYLFHHSFISSPVVSLSFWWSLVVVELLLNYRLFI